MKIIFRTLISLLLISSCNTQPTLQTSIFDKINKQGHRGCRGLMPENTIPAFIKAIDLGVNTLEMDVVISKDKKVIVSHENYFNHETTTLPSGDTILKEHQEEFNIYKMDYSEVAKFDVGLKFNPNYPQQAKVKAYKPLLSEVIDTLELYAKVNNKPTLYYNIETKLLPPTDSIFHPAPTEFVELLMAVIFEKGIEKRVTIESFDIRTLQYLHKQHPEIITSLLVEDFDHKEFSQQLIDLGFTPNIYSPAKEHVTAKLVAECKAKNVKLIPWTVNDIKTMREFVELGVDGILTDYPNLFSEK